MARPTPKRPTAKPRRSGKHKKKSAAGLAATKRPARASQPGYVPADCTVYVCRSCVWSEEAREREGKRQGTFLFEAVNALVTADPLPEGTNLRAVFCLNGCKSPCNVAFRARGKHHVRFSHLTPDNAADLLAYARAYAAQTDGDVADDDTPAGLRGKITVRTPPIGA